jgi:hypothetical protein
MHGQIAGLLAHARPPLPAGRPEAMAVVILQLMRAAVAIHAQDATQEEEPARREALNELRRMLITHLDRAEP